MNILHIEDEPWDSGIAHYAVTLAAAQAAQGHRVRFWGATGSPVLVQAAEAGLQTRGYPRGLRRCGAILSLRREAAEFSPKIVNAHTGSAHLLALTTAPPSAAVVRTRADARGARATFLTRAIASRTAMFIAANSNLKSSLESAFPASRVRLIPQGIAAPVDVSPLPNETILGMIARLDPVKGHSLLLDAVVRLRPRIPGLRLRLAGEGRLRCELLSQLRKQHLEDVVDLAGRVSDKWDFFSGCRIGIIASTRSEAVSRAALEWMAAGRPIIATRVGGLLDIVEDGVTGLLVAPGDDSALAAAIHSLWVVPERAAVMGRSARKRWHDKFSLDPFYQTTQGAYEEAINPFPRRR